MSLIMHWRLAGDVGIVVGGFLVAVLLAVSSAYGQGNVVAGIDALMAINSNDTGGTVMGAENWGGYGRFSYGTDNAMSVTPSVELGRYGAFEIQYTGTSGSGFGFNNFNGPVDNPISFDEIVDPVTADMFPLLDRAGWGANFDPSQYRAELVFKPMPDNDGDGLNLTLDTFDGFSADGERIAEQWQYNFTSLANPTGTPDADGFYTVYNRTGSLVPDAANYNGPSYMFATSPLPATGMGDGEADFNDFEGDVLPVPNGIRQLQLQSEYNDNSANDHFLIKRIRLIKIDPDPQEVARIDGHSGFSNRFGSPFRRGAGDPLINIGGTDYFPAEGGNPANTDQVSRFDENGFTNIFLKTHDDAEIGGLQLWQPTTDQGFDGTTATVDVTARLTEEQGEGQADHIVLIAKDKDGNDDEPGDGGEEYHYELPLNLFNTSDLTTVSVPLTDFTLLAAQEFVNEGDGLLTDFNLYMLGLQTDVGVGLVNMELESIRVMLPAPSGLLGDYNEDGFVNAADYVVWRNLNGTEAELPNRDPNASGQIGEADYTYWAERFGNSAPGGGTTASVPEPATFLLMLVAMVAAAVRRGRTQ